MGELTISTKSSPPLPPYACIFMDYIETEFLKTIYKTMDVETIL